MRENTTIIFIFRLPLDKHDYIYIPFFRFWFGRDFFFPFFPSLHVWEKNGRAKMGACIYPLGVNISFLPTIFLNT